MSPQLAARYTSIPPTVSWVLFMEFVGSENETNSASLREESIDAGRLFTLLIDSSLPEGFFVPFEPPLHRLRLEDKAPKVLNERLRPAASNVDRSDLTDSRLDSFQVTDSLALQLGSFPPSTLQGPRMRNILKLLPALTFYSHFSLGK